ncbi:MAG: histidine phosphatase family protein [Propionicimonas sp.]|nr:histidine phosphatase family protein [Propionicimonas sp.]
MTAERVVLLRHGVTEWNASRRFQGHEDIPLSADGVAQARRAAEVLAGCQPARVLSSDLSRARATAGFVAEAAGVPVETDPRFREVDVGSWAGLSLDAVAEVEPDFWPAIREGRDFRRSPEGETATESGERVAAAITEYARAADDGDVLVVVGHGLSLAVASFLLIGLDYSHARRFGGLANCGWIDLEPGDAGWRMRAYNRVVG